MFGGGNGNYFRIRSQDDAEQFMRDRDESPYYRVRGRGGRLPWILLAVIVVAALIAFAVSVLV